MTGIWSEEAGDASHPLIAIVHGAMDRSAGMLKLSRRLDERYRVLRYDRRGYGRSNPHPGPFGIDAQVADLVDLLAGRRAVVVGHSYGGNVALATACRHPELVAGVAVYETPMSWEPWWPGTTAGATAIAAQEGGTEMAAERFMRRLVGDARWEALPERTRAIRRAEGAALVGELADLRERAPWHAAGVHVPVMVGNGSLGAAHHQDGMARMAAAIPGARLVVLEGCRHDAPTSHPAEFCHQLVEPLLAAVDWSGQLDVGAEEPAGHRSGGTGRHVGLRLVGTIDEARALGPRSEGEAAHQHHHDELGDDALHEPGR
jgi:pimeloyl-ACP methyl ester carboxylesterase